VQLQANGPRLGIGRGLGGIERLGVTDLHIHRVTAGVVDQASLGVEPADPIGGTLGVGEPADRRNILLEELGDFNDHGARVIILCPDVEYLDDRLEIIAADRPAYRKGITGNVVVGQLSQHDPVAPALPPKHLLRDHPAGGKKPGEPGG
jgi:hypothetical protein